MSSRSGNELLTRTDRGTPMGGSSCGRTGSRSCCPTNSLPMLRGDGQATDVLVRRTRGSRMADGFWLAVHRRGTYQKQPDLSTDRTTSVRCL
jgi:hypothetical protein